MKRLIEFADKHQLDIELAYYPPYHSKYNPVERCWSSLERHWNGTLLIDEASELENASTRSGSSPVRTTEGLLAPGSAELFPKATWVSVAGMRDLAAQAPRE